MIRKLTILLVVLLVLPIALKAQVAPSAITGGAVYNGSFGFNLSLATRIGTGPVWVGMAGDFGQSVEFGAQAAALFKIRDGLYAGPVANLISDYSDRPGTEEATIVNYLANAVGIAATYSFTTKIGVWGLTRYQSGLGDNLYKDGWIAGIGFYMTL